MPQTTVTQSSTRSLTCVKLTVFDIAAEDAAKNGLCIPETFVRCWKPRVRRVQRHRAILLGDESEAFTA
jgi:hypothetical protein